jgi:DNA (cytosine-5)-methyltransferase 1
MSTFRENNSDVPTYQGTIKSLDMYLDDLDSLSPDLTLPTPSQVDILVAGLPKSLGSKQNDPLIDSLMSVTNHLSPTFVLLEATTGLLETKGGDTMGTLFSKLLEMGYQCSSKLLNASSFGVPQNRSTLFITAAKLGYPLPISPTATHHTIPRSCTGPPDHCSIWVSHSTTAAHHPDNLLDPVTVADAISDLPTEKGSTSYTHPPLGTYQKSMRGSTPTVENILTAPISEKAALMISTAPYGPGHSLTEKGPVRENRLQWNKQFNTIACRLRWTSQLVIHPCLNRTISVRETARAQSFPDSYVFHGKIASIYVQIGDAVPPRMAHQIALTYKAAFIPKTQ